ncbi:hypothetical protein [Pseudomonas nitroreducens]|uniref:hypothetical protein n=1 Tax=Pseudomonas nitroreducens TaxID=46680 RepID=UPI00351D0A27
MRPDQPKNQAKQFATENLSALCQEFIAWSNGTGFLPGSKLEDLAAICETYLGSVSQSELSREVETIVVQSALLFTAGLNPSHEETFEALRRGFQISIGAVNPGQP